MKGFWVSLADLVGRLVAPPGFLVEWLGSQQVEELDARGVDMWREGRIAIMVEADLSTSLPTCFDQEQENVPFQRLRFLRNPPRLETSTTLAMLERAYRGGYFAEILKAGSSSGAPDLQLEIYKAASLSEIGRYAEALEVLERVADKTLPVELGFRRLEAHMATLRHCGRPAEALEIWQRHPTVGSSSVLLEARHLIAGATARFAADRRDALALPALDRAIALLSQETAEEMSEALMHRARLLRGDGRLDEAESSLLQSLECLTGSDALHLSGRVFGNLAGIYLDREDKTSALVVASAAACCFRHVGCLHDLLKSLSIIATEDPDSDRKSRYMREASELADLLRYPCPAVALPLHQAADACSPDDLACISSGGGVGTRVLSSWSHEQGSRVGLEPEQMLIWTILGAKMYHAAVRRGRPALILDGDAIVAAADHWFGAMYQKGTDENIQYRGILHYLEHEFPGTHLQFAATALSIFRTQVNVPLDGSAEKTVFNIILDALLMGFRLEFAFDNACADVLEQSQMEGGLEEILKLPQAEGAAEVFDLPALTSLLVPDALPWPTDQRCRCGADLTRFIHCCTPEEPLVMADYRGKLRPGFQIERECCGAMLSGFRCDCCHQLYTWDLGVDETSTKGNG